MGHGRGMSGHVIEKLQQVVARVPAGASLDELGLGGQLVQLAVWEAEEDLDDVDVVPPGGNVEGARSHVHHLMLLGQDALVSGDSGKDGDAEHCVKFAYLLPPGHAAWALRVFVEEEGIGVGAEVDAAQGELGISEEAGPT